MLIVHTNVHARGHFLDIGALMCETLSVGHHEQLVYTGTSSLPESYAKTKHCLWKTCFMLVEIFLRNRKRKLPDLNHASQTEHHCNTAVFVDHGQAPCHALGWKHFRSWHPARPRPLFLLRLVKSRYHRDCSRSWSFQFALPVLLGGLGYDQPHVV